MPQKVKIAYSLWHIRISEAEEHRLQGRQIINDTEKEVISPVTVREF
jgi:hypothetical protein